MGFGRASFSNGPYRLQRHTGGGCHLVVGLGVLPWGALGPYGRRATAGPPWTCHRWRLGEKRKCLLPSWRGTAFGLECYMEVAVQPPGLLHRHCLRACDTAFGRGRSWARKRWGLAAALPWTLPTLRGTLAQRRSITTNWAAMLHFLRACGVCAAFEGDIRRASSVLFCLGLAVRPRAAGPGAAFGLGLTLRPLGMGAK